MLVANSAMEVTNHKLQKLKKKLSKIDAEKDAAVKQSEDLRQVLTEERAAVSDLSHLTEKLTTEMAALENERRKLQMELQTMKAECVLLLFFSLSFSFMCRFFGKVCEGWCLTRGFSYDRIIVGVVRSAQDAIEGKTKEKKLMGTWKVLEISQSVNLKVPLRLSLHFGFLSVHTYSRYLILTPLLQQEIRHHQSISASPSASPAGSHISRSGDAPSVSTMSSSVYAGVEHWGVFQVRGPIVSRVK